MEKDNVMLAIITCPEERGPSLARGLVEKDLAACVQISGGVSSFYKWEGVLNEDKEALLLVKTTRTQLFMIEDYLNEHHPYQVPELIAFEVDQGSEAYLKWVVDSFKA